MEQKEQPEVAMNFTWQKQKENPVTCALMPKFVEGLTHMLFSKTTSAACPLSSWKRSRHTETLLH